MWKCRNCDTVNNGDKCNVCGALRPDDNQQRQGANYKTSEYDTKPFAHDESKRQPFEDYRRDTVQSKPPADNRSAFAIGVLSALAVVAIAVVIVLVIYINGMDSKDDKSDSPAQNQTEQSTENTLQEEITPPESEDKTAEDKALNGDVTDGSEADKPEDEPPADNAMNPSQDYKDPDVEEYVATAVQPPYYRTVNSDCFIETKISDGVTHYIPDGTDDSVCAYTVYKPGSKGDNKSRMYYFDQQSGMLLFAFVFDGTTEYRFYFRDDTLVRYKAPNGKITDNPTDPGLVNMANQYLNEAYFDF